MVILLVPSVSAVSHFATSFLLLDVARNFASPGNFGAMYYPLGQGYLISRILESDDHERIDDRRHYRSGMRKRIKRNL